VITSEEIKVIILNPLDDNKWTTGGERRLWEIREYFKKRTENLNVISYSDFPFRVKAVHFFLTNIWLFRKINGQGFSDNKTAFILSANSSLFTFLATALLRIFCQIKIIVTVEHFKDPPLSSFKYFLARIPWFFANLVCLHTAHLVIGVSKSTRRECRKMGVTARKIRIIPNGINKIPNFEKQDSYGNQNETVDILFIGYCARIKGLRYLVDAMRMLQRQGAKNYFLHLVGDTQKDPKYLRRIQRFIHDNSLNGRIRFYGRIYGKELECAWEKANMLILPSLWESYGLVIIEAMNRGIPVIATNVGAIPELITDGVSGLLVPPRDCHALAEAIKRLSEDIALRQKLIEGGYRVAANTLSWEESCEKFYQEVSTLFKEQLT